VTAIKLTGQQIKRLRDALLNAYSKKALKDLLLFNLEKTISHIVSETEDDRTIVSEVIATARQEGWLSDLIKQAYEERQSDVELKALYKELQPMISAAAFDHYTARFLGKDWPILNRGDMREALRRLDGQLQSRIFVIDGEPGSGKTYSVQFISYLREQYENFQMALIDLPLLMQMSSDGTGRLGDVGTSICSQWSITGKQTDQKDQNEQDSRWIVQFCDWLTGQLSNATLPHWVVIDHFDKALISQGTQDLIQQLAIRAYVNMPMLRLVLLSYKNIAGLRANVRGQIEYEQIRPLNDEDVIRFFDSEYRERQQQRNVAYVEKDIAASVARVWSAVDHTHVKRLEHLRYAVAAEVSRLEL